MNANRRRRAQVAEPIATEHGGVVSRTALRERGVSRDDVRTEIRAGRWSSAGRHTVVIGGDARITTDLGRWWWAVNIPPPNACYRHNGVRVHRRRVMGPLSGGGPPRARLDWATIRAAQWAVSDRQAALIVAMPVQQRLILPAQLLATWREVHRSRRRQLLDHVIPDVCDGAHSLGELDFAVLCRRHGLPEPRRQSVRSGRTGRVYLDVEFDGGLVVEIDGGHHQLGLAPMDDALRANEVTLSGSRVLRIPLLGLRLAPDAFLNQVARALDGGTARQMRSHLPLSA